MKSVGFPVAPPGWHYDEDTGALMRDVIHRMGRRCRNWDYRGKGVYQITITLDDRRSQALGRLGHEEKRGAFVELSELGRLVEVNGSQSIEKANEDILAAIGAKV